MMGVTVTAYFQLPGVSSIPPECKWPNDILLNKKKVCGVLSEVEFRHNKLWGVIIGIGLNVNQSSFPPELEATATSLAIDHHHKFERAKVLSTILEKLEAWYEILQKGNVQDIVAEWQTHSTMLGKEITIEQQGRTFRGIAKSLDTDGGLILMRDNIEEKLFAGDVTILKEKIS